MKKTLLALSLLPFLSFAQTPTHSATPMVYQGVAIYHDALPSIPYDTVGDFRVIVCVACQYNGVRDKAVKMALDKYRGFDGLILTGNLGERVVVVRYRK